LSSDWRDRKVVVAGAGFPSAERRGAVVRKVRRRVGRDIAMELRVNWRRRRDMVAGRTIGAAEGVVCFEREVVELRKAGRSFARKERQIETKCR
jgi:hypothetical protein